MRSLRTPDERFADLPDYGFAPHYADVDDTEGGTLRVHYLDEGSGDAPPVLLMHGEPSWCFLYRKMIPVLVDAGLRCVAPDLVGFGRSDKPADATDYTYVRHVTWMADLLCRQLDLRNATFFGQDWGGLVGLRVVAENADRFARVVVANTGLPTGEGRMTDAFLAWQRFSQEADPLPVGAIVDGGTATDLPPEVIAAYDAPFPEERYKEGARELPALVPTRPDDPAGEANRRAWVSLRAFHRPFLCAFSDGDPITRGADRLFTRAVPGAAGQPHVTIAGGGHFLQEDRGEELAGIVADFIDRTAYASTR